MRSIFIALSLTSLAALAQSPDPSPVASATPGRREIKIQHLMTKPPEAEDSAPTVKVEQTCTNEAGQELRKGEAGFDICMSRVNLQAQQNATNPGAPKKPHEAAAGTSFKFKTGK